MESWNKVLPTWILRRLHSLSCSLDPLPLPPSPPSSLSISFSLVLLSWPPKQRGTPFRARSRITCLSDCDFFTNGHYKESKGLYFDQCYQGLCLSIIISSLMIID